MEVLSSDNAVYYCVFFALLATNFIVCYCIDHLLLQKLCTTNNNTLRSSVSPFNSYESNTTHYKLVEKHLEGDPSWPPYSTFL